MLSFLKRMTAKVTQAAASALRSPRDADLPPVLDKPVTEIVRIYSLCERALVTDWCMHNGSYSLGDFSREYMPVLFGSFRV